MIDRMKDHLGNIRQTFRDDGTVATVVSTEDYYPFGATLKSTTTQLPAQDKFKYQGKERDQETGYDYFEARLYDSQLGRFLQVDPLWENFKTSNAFVGMGDNPVRLVDPTGMGDEESDEKKKKEKKDPKPEVKEEEKKEEKKYDLENGKNLPKTIETVDPNGKKVTVTVTFSTKTKDGKTGDNKISPTSVAGFTEGVQIANKNGAGITSINVGSTTNGTHSSSKSNHYVENGAKAIDINLINGSVPDSTGSIILQSSMDSVKTIYENFGPFFDHKDGKSTNTDQGHDSWIHISFDK